MQKELLIEYDFTGYYIPKRNMYDIDPAYLNHVIEQIDKVNVILAEGVEVYYASAGMWDSSEKPRDTTSKALLINIQPIKKETAEDVLRDMLNQWNSHSGYCLPPGIKERAKAVLNE